MPKLIGIAGRKRAGKDTAMVPLKDMGFTSIAFAEPMKAMLATLLRMQEVDEETIDRMLHGDLKEEPSPFFGGRSPRYALQTIGTEWGRDQMGKSFWRDIGLNRAKAMMAKGQSVAITDVRFHNEAVGIDVADGMTVRIERPGRPTDAADSHASEQEIDELKVDFVLTNDAPDAKGFERDARSFFATALGFQ